ncbi:hypothetical protein CHCC12620_2314 [Bacillus paralicheniformis]|nr:hypothetical protein CHCC12620_2314 [Bacillus paralicheniformis]
MRRRPKAKRFASFGRLAAASYWTSGILDASNNWLIDQ